MASIGTCSPLDAKLTPFAIFLSLASGETKTLNIKGIHIDQIKADLFSLETSKRAAPKAASPSL